MGNTYKLSGESNGFAKSLVVGDIDTYIYQGSMQCVEQYKIEDNKLFLTSFICLIDINDEYKIKTEYKDKMKISRVKTHFLKNDRFFEQEVIEVLYDGMNIPCPYSGQIYARQYYPDEVEACGKTHLEEDLFVFSDGCIDLEKSKVSCRDGLFVTQFAWLDGVDHHSRSGAYSSQDGKVFFLDPIGSYLQQDGVFARYVNYFASRRIRKELIDDLLEYKKPVLRTEMMFQKGIGTDEFEKRAFDLPLLAIRFLDVETLRWMYDYIQFDDYKDYPEWMLEELFSEWYEKSKEQGTLEYIRILELFVEKELNCKNADSFISLFKEDRGLTSEESEEIVGLLEKLKYIEEVA